MGERREYERIVSLRASASLRLRFLFARRGQKFAALERCKQFPRERIVARRETSVTIARAQRVQLLEVQHPSLVGRASARLSRIHTRRRSYRRRNGDSGNGDREGGPTTMHLHRLRSASDAHKQRQRQ